MNNIPDHPIIRNCEETGYPDRREDREPTCPMCGRRCDTIYKDRDGDIFGCDECVKDVDAWEAMYDGEL
jgi:hypothetical protein